MKRCFALVMLGLFSAVFALAAEPQPTSTLVRISHHRGKRVHRHHAHKAGKHHTPQRHPHHAV